MIYKDAGPRYLEILYCVADGFFTTERIGIVLSTYCFVPAFHFSLLLSIGHVRFFHLLFFYPWYIPWWKQRRGLHADTVMCAKHFSSIIRSSIPCSALRNLYQCRKRNTTKRRATINQLGQIPPFTIWYTITRLYLIKTRSQRTLRCAPNSKVPMIKIFINLVIHRRDTYIVPRVH